MALLGHWPWQRIVPIPPELILLPPSAPFSVYNFACWARQTFVPLSVVCALRPVRPPTWTSARSARAPASRGRRAGRTRSAAARSPPPSTGCGTARKPTAAGAGSSRRGSGRSSCSPRSATASRTNAAPRGRGWERLHDRRRRPPPARGLPVTDLGHRPRPARAPGGGRPARRPAAAQGGEWLLGEEIRVKGDWSIRRPDLEPAGWAFEFENDLYPDIDDTAVIALGLASSGWARTPSGAVSTGSSACSPRTAAGARSTSTTRATGSTSCPFCDFGYVIDPPSEDVTAHALEVLAQDPRLRRRGRARRRVPAQGAAGGRLLVGPLGREPRLRHRRRPAGARGLRVRARPSGDPPRRRLARLRPATRAAASARTSAPTTSPPGAAAESPPLHKRPGRLLGYVAAGEAESEPARRAADYLCAAQEPNGDWSEEHYTGTGFPTDFMIRYHLYRLYFPLMALGRLRERLIA